MMTKKRIQVSMIAVVICLAAVGWSSNVEAACDNATFTCHDINWTKLGEVSVTCSEQLPFNALIPRCLPNFPVSTFASIDVCKSTYRAAVRACPNQAWPSGYAYSKCVSYPGY